MQIVIKAHRWAELLPQERQELLRISQDYIGDNELLKAVWIMDDIEHRMSNSQVWRFMLGTSKPVTKESGHLSEVVLRTLTDRKN